MKLSIIADEISQDPHAAVYIGTTSMDIHWYEMRFVMGRRVPDIDEEQVRELAWLKDRYDIRYSAISAGLFKCVPDAEAIDREMGRVEQAIALAKTLGVTTITGFALHDTDAHRPAELREMLLPYLQQALRMTDAAGITLAIETEYMTGVENAKDAKLLAGMAGPSLRVNWDPANSWVAGEHPLEGYAHVKDLLANMHVKDADTREWRERNPFVALGDGLVPWEELIPLLKRDNPLRVLTVETHIEPLIPKSLKSVANLRRLLAQ